MVIVVGIPDDSRVREKEDEKVEKYQDLAKEVVNGTGVFEEGASPGRVAGGQQPAPRRYPATAA